MSVILLQNVLLLGVTAGLVHRGRRLGLLRAALGTAVALLLVALVLAVVLVSQPDHPAFGALGLFAWAPFVHLPLALLALAALSWRTARSGAALAGVAAVGVIAIGVWSFFIEPRWLEVTRHELLSDRVERPLRIVLLADVQTDRVGEHERRALRLAAEHSPDLVLFAGDYVQVPSPQPERRVREVTRLREALLEAGLAPRLGAFAVQGDVDPPGWEAVFEGTGVVALPGTVELDLGELRLSALSLADSRRPTRAVARGERFHVVFGHRPDFALDDFDADLLLAGHCHGGQVRLPFLGPPLIASRIPRAWSTGAHEIRPDTTLVVSRGIGVERVGAPPLRFNCRPEVVVIDVLPRFRPAAFAPQ